MNILEHIPFGRENAMKRGELALILGVSDREARKIINHYRAQWVPLEPFICSDSSKCGYWLSKDLDEIERCRNFLYSYGNGYIIANIDRHLAELNGTGLVPVRAHFRRVRKAVNDAGA